MATAKTTAIERGQKCADLRRREAKSPRHADALRAHIGADAWKRAEVEKRSSGLLIRTGSSETCPTFEPLP
jgi:hypothetical protein